MSYETILVAVGLVLLVVEMILPLGYIGAVGAAIVTGGVVGLVFPGHFWTALIVGSAFSLTLSRWLTLYFYQLTEDLSNLVTAASNLIGEQAVVVEPIDPVSRTGKVSIDGEVWAAEAGGAIETGSTVRLEAIDGGRALVTESESQATSP